MLPGLTARTRCLALILNMFNLHEGLVYPPVIVCCPLKMSSAHFRHADGFQALMEPLLCGQDKLSPGLVGMLTVAG